MPDLVLDASVVCNRLLDQTWSKQAASVFASDLALIAPALARLETASALWAAARAHALTPDEAAARFDEIERLPLDFVDDPAVEVLGIQLALSHGLSPYDTQYIALALFEDCGLVTADRRQYEVAEGSCGFAQRAVWLGNV